MALRPRPLYYECMNGSELFTLCCLRSGSDLSKLLIKITT